MGATGWAPDRGIAGGRVPPRSWNALTQGVRKRALTVHLVKQDDVVTQNINDLGKLRARGYEKRDMLAEMRHTEG
jgi:hypothetical protein